MNLEGECYHKTCFRCAHAGCPLTHSSYAALDGVLYCKHHFAQLFMEKGNYHHILQAAANKKNSTPPNEPEESKPEQPSEDSNTEEKENKEQWSQGTHTLINLGTHQSINCFLPHQCHCQRFLCTPFAQ